MSAFLLYTESREDFFGPKDWYECFFEELKNGEKNRLGMCWDYSEDSLIEQGDLIIVMERGETRPLLLAVGRATSDYKHVSDGKHEGHVVDIHFDFIIGEHKDFTAFSSLLKKANIDLYELQKKEILLPPDVAETLMKRFAAVHMACSHPHSFLAFNPNGDKKQLLCDYLNDFCPEFRQEVIKRFPLVYHNYKEGEIIDRSLIDLTYDKTVTGFPGGILDWDRLFDIVRPRA